MNKVLNYLASERFLAHVCLAAGVMCLFGVIMKGAWWHLWTAAICGVLYVSLKPEPEKEK